MVGTVENGIYASTDNGATWNARNNGLVNKNISALVSQGSKLFAATYGGLFVSDNDGLVWNTVIIGGYGGIPLYSAIVNSQAMIIATSDSLLRSTDYGATWQNVLPSTNGETAICMAVNGPLMYVGVNDWGFYKSVDYGQSFGWYPVSIGGFNSFLITGTKVLAAAGGQVYASSDGGSTWSSSSTGITPGGVQKLFTNGTRIYAGLTVDPSPGWPGGLYYSDNTGANWTYCGMMDYSLKTLEFDGNRLISGTSPGGIFISDNAGVSWQESSNGLVRQTVQAFTMNGWNIFAATPGEGMMRSADRGKTWMHINNGLPTWSLNAVAYISPVLFAAGSGIYRSTDNGVSWSPAFMPGFNVTCLATLGSRLFAGTTFNNSTTPGGGIFASDDLGLTWHAANNGLTNTTVYALAATGTDLLAGTDEGVFISSDYGSSWSQENNGLSYIHVRAIGANPGQVYASTFYHDLWQDYQSAIFRSGNKGAEWVNSGVEFPDGSLCSSFVSSGNKMFAGVLQGLVPAVMTDDNGQTWSAEHTGLPVESSIQSLSVVDSIAYAAVESGNPSFYLTGLGIWTRPLSEMIAFSIHPDTLFLGRPAGSTGSLALSSSTPWTLNGLLPGWLKSDKSGGTASGNVLFTATQANPWDPPRDCSLDFVSSGFSRHLVVIQNGRVTSIAVPGSREISIYPNPSTGIFCIEPGSRFDHLTVYNALGKIILEQPVTPGKTWVNLTLSGKGVYYLKFSGKEVTSVKEAVVM